MSSENALAERLSFMKLGPEQQKRLRDAKSVLMRVLPSALDRFYEQVQQFPKPRSLFKDSAHISAAKSRQLNHWETISNGVFDGAYERAVTSIGEVHARIGLEPRWYIGGYALLLESMIAALVTAHWPKAAFGQKASSADRVIQELIAVTKAGMLDMDLALSVYIARGVTEAERLKAETEALSAERSEVVRLVSAAMAALADGDLTGRLSDDIPPEYAELKDNFNRAMNQLQQTIGAVSASTDGLRGGAEEIASAADDLSQRTERQAAGLEQTAAALDQITATVKRSAEGARKASVVVSGAKADAVRSGQVVAEAVAAMGEIEQSSGQITQIIGVIDEIAFQTNLLALNAGVEAARAGDAGRGFAVVAQEVRALAQRSADAAKQIKALIAASSSQVERGVRLVDDTGVVLTGIVGKVAEIDTLVVEIATSSQEQSTGLAQVNSAVNEMDQVTQQNAAMVEQATAAASNLKAEALELARLVSVFRTGHAPAPTARAAASKPIARPQARLAVGGGRGAASSVKAGSWEEF
jgi:methyl-accepting chemotaxis protein